jgi:uncharacterized membrane protein
MWNKVVWACFGFILAASLIYTSCANTQSQIPTKISPTPGIETAEKRVGDAAKTIEGTTNIIISEAKTGMQKTPIAAQPVLNPHWTEILTQTGVQKNVVDQLKQTQQELSVTKERSQALEGERNKLVKENTSLKDNVTKEAREKYLTFSIVLFGLALVAGGIGIWMNGNKFVLAISALSAVGALACIFVVQTIALIPYIMIGLAVIVLGVLFYSFYKKHSDLSTYKNATTQLVATVENAKPFMTVDGRKKIFGDGSVFGLAHLIQDDKTQTVVDGLRNDLEKAPPIPGTVAADHTPAPAVAAPVPVEAATPVPEEEPLTFSGQTDAVPAETDSMATDSTSAAKLKRRCGSRKITGGPSKRQVLFV